MQEEKQIKSKDEVVKDYKSQLQCTRALSRQQPCNLLQSLL